MGSGSNDDESINEVGGSVAVGSPADAVDHLYGLAPTEFIAARNEMAKAARAAGERELAADIKAMRKPSTVAAELNRILRLDQDRLQALLQAALTLRDGHQSVLSGEEVDLIELQSAHRDAAATLAAPAEAHRDRLQALLEAASLDVACHDDLQRAAYVAEPAPALGFDLFSPQVSPDGPDSNATATVSSISQARTRKRRREAEKRQQAPRSKQKQKQKSNLPIDPDAETDTDAGAEAAAAAAERRAEAESALADASSAHGRAEASLTLAYRQAEAAAKKHAKATERLSEAERQLSEAASQLTKADKALSKAKERSDAAEQLLSSTADALREAQARMRAETPDATHKKT